MQGGVCTEQARAFWDRAGCPVRKYHSLAHSLIDHRLTVPPPERNTPFSSRLTAGRNRIGLAVSPTQAFHAVSELWETASFATKMGWHHSSEDQRLTMEVAPR